MILQPGGIDIFYIDESTDRQVQCMVAIAIPFLLNVDGVWSLAWEDHFEQAREWRRYLSRQHGIPVKKELKASNAEGM